MVPPFPNIIFEPVPPLWDEHIILCLSLSKLGLPGARTGIIIAAEQTIQAITNANAILNLAPGKLWPDLDDRIHQQRKNPGHL